MMRKMNHFNLATLVISAIVFGISNGLSPGPTLTLVISHTIHHDYKAGIKVACGPILFGLIVVPISVFVSIQIDTYKIIMGLISVIGALFITYLGIKNLFLKKVKLDQSFKKVKSFKIGVFANFSNPYAYIFWFTVGAPLIINTQASSFPAAILFVFIYYFCLVGSKIAVALIVEKFRSMINKVYSYVMFLLGITLFIFAYYMFKNGIAFLV